MKKTHTVASSDQVVNLRAGRPSQPESLGLTIISIRIFKDVLKKKFNLISNSFKITMTP